MPPQNVAPILKRLGLKGLVLRGPRYHLDDIAIELERRINQLVDGFQGFDGRTLRRHPFVGKVFEYRARCILADLGPTIWPNGARGPWLCRPGEDDLSQVELTWDQHKTEYVASVLPVQGPDSTVESNRTSLR